MTIERERERTYLQFLRFLFIINFYLITLMDILAFQCVGTFSVPGGPTMACSNESSALKQVHQLFMQEHILQPKSHIGLTPAQSKSFLHRYDGVIGPLPSASIQRSDKPFFFFSNVK